MGGVSLVWFRNDLRLTDHPALTAAVAAGRPIVPIYILDEETPGLRSPGGASRWWLHHSLAALDASLKAIGSRLILRRGPAERIIKEIAEAIDVSGLYWNRTYDRPARERDARLKENVKSRGGTAESFNGNLLFEPWEIKTGTGGPFQVFTPFWRACRSARPPMAPQPPPTKLPAPRKWPASDALDQWGLRPAKPDWAGGLREGWTPGEAAAADCLDRFLDRRLESYRAGRDMPSADATSRLSPHLAFGEISPRRIWHTATATRASAALDKFLSELGWREFSYHLLFHHDELARRCFRPAFENFPWVNDPQVLDAWQRGRTGYPLVDAGMRELWTTGWMHNRVRMITGSFLVKDLMIDWRAGERWFWDTLVDADPANNAASWQWVAGCGADAAPFFRIFNPLLQAEKTDPDGDYVRRWLPELAHLPGAKIHRPWLADLPGSVYPSRIVDHAAARSRALAAFQGLKKAS